MKPVIIISSHTAGLGVIRALGRVGVPIVALYYQKNDMGYVSKYVTEAIPVPHPEDHENEFVKALTACGKRYPGSLMIPTDDASLGTVSRHKDVLELHNKISCPGWDIVQHLIDKRFTYKIAEENGIPIPLTLFPRSINDVENLKSDFSYPFIVKPSLSHRYFCILERKMTLVHNRNELLAEYKKATSLDLEIMLQEYIPGNESSNVNYCSYFWDGRSLVEFTARKVRQAPPFFGVPCVLLSENIPEIIYPSREILRALGYSGYSCIEFKRDERDGIYKLLDVNGRMNLSILHSMKCGINFPWLTYNHLINGELPKTRTFEENTYWIDMTKDVMNYLQVFKQNRKSVRGMLIPYFKPKAFAIFDLRDIRPFMKRCGYFLERLRHAEKTIEKHDSSHVHKRKKIYIEGEACNRRLLEKSKIKRYLECNDYELVNRPAKASHILLVTCAFKKKEEEHSIARLRDLMNYDAELLVYGCLPDISPHKYSEFHRIKNLAPKDLDEIDTFFDDIKIRYANVPDENVIDFYSSTSLLENIRDKVASNKVLSGEFIIHLAASGKKHLRKILFKSKREYFLFICKGCLGRCSYCAITRSIGSVRSKPVDVILEEFRRGVRGGYHNISILGDDPGCYGHDINLTFIDILKRLLDECKQYNHMAQTSGNNHKEIKLHIKEIHPKHLIRYKDEAIDLLKDRHIESILCPIQSGNNRILGLMRREHTTEDIFDVISEIKRINPPMELSTQIIVGFPTETEKEFHDTLDFVKRSKFDSVVVFPYHDKDNTPASQMGARVPDDVITERVRIALDCFRKRKMKAYTQCPS